MDLPRLGKILNPTLLLPAVLAGLISGTLVLVLQISFAALVFSGDLSPYIGIGLGLSLFSGIVLALVVALTSSFPVAIASPQDSPAALIALIGTSLTAVLSENRNSSAALATVLAAIALTTLLTGAFFFGLGWFGLGRFVRYIPFPVVGGFLAGTGWLLLQGGINVMTGAQLSPEWFYLLSQPTVLTRWLPGILFGIVLLLILRKWTHALITPAFVLLAIALFYIVLSFSGISVQVARERSWMLGPFPSGGLFQFSTFGALLDANWFAILRQTDKIGTVLLVSVVAMLLNASGIELATQRDIDFNHELKSVGLANLVASLFSGLPGYHVLSGSALSYKMGARSRLTGVVAGLLIAFTLFFGASLLEYVPRVVLGGLLSFLGLSFLADWLIDTFFKLPRLDYALIVLILAVIAGFGFLPGVGVGVIVAMLLFIVNYSRIQVVRHSLTAANFRSAVDRPPAERARLREMGDQMLILQLQAFIFFGTGQHLLDRIRNRIDDPTQPPLRYLVMDFQHVPALDSSAIASFLRLTQLTDTHQIRVLFTEVHSSMRQQLERGGLHGVQFFATLDAAVEECENQILAAHPSPLDAIYYSMQAQVLEFVPRHNDRERLALYLERIELPANRLLLKQGDLADAMYFIEEGQVSVDLVLDNGKNMRLRTIQAGAVVGEIAVYLMGERTASVTTIKPTIAYRLPTEALRNMEHQDPALAAGIHKWMATMMAERLADQVRVLRQLMN